MTINAATNSFIKLDTVTKSLMFMHREAAQLMDF